MRTTLDIDIDVLQAAKERAHRENRTTGQVLSDLARQALTGTPKPAQGSPEPSRHGFRPFPRRGGIVTNELIDALREDDAY